MPKSPHRVPRKTLGGGVRAWVGIGTAGLGREVKDACLCAGWWRIEARLADHDRGLSSSFWAAVGRAPRLDSDAGTRLVLDGVRTIAERVRRGVTLFQGTESPGY